MAVILYRGESETIRINPKHLSAHLEAGWQLKKNVPRETVQEADDQVAAENDKYAIVKDEPSLEALRAEAKEKGIEGWETMRTKRLMRELGYENKS